MCPLDAELSLPPRCYSDLLRDWAEYCTTTESYDESNHVLKGILDISISKLALETGVQEDDVDSGALTSRPAPVGKEVRATLYGKDRDFERLVHSVAQRECDHIQHRVALTDGDDTLQSQMEDRLSTFTLVLDIIHVSEYLWDAANALLGEKDPDRAAWVKDRLLLILSDKTEDVIQDLESHL